MRFRLRTLLIVSLLLCISAPFWPYLWAVVSSEPINTNRWVEEVWPQWRKNNSEGESNYSKELRKLEEMRNEELRKLQGLDNGESSVKDPLESRGLSFRR